MVFYIVKRLEACFRKPKLAIMDEREGGLATKRTERRKSCHFVKIERTMERK